MSQKKSANSFTVEVEHLQKYAYKESVRDLNAQFQRMGGHVTFKHSKAGHKVKLSHPDTDYLEKFKTALFREIGLLKKGPAEETAEAERARTVAPTETGTVMEGTAPAAPAQPTERDTPLPETETGTEAGTKVEMQEGAAVGAEPVEEVPTAAPEKDPALIPDMKPRLEGITDEELEDAKGLIAEALERGAIDDGMIIRNAYEEEYDEDRIKVLRKVLRSNVCAYDKWCKFKRRELRFEDVMHGCCGAKNDCRYSRGELNAFYTQWRENLDAMFRPFEGKTLAVTGKISQYRFKKRKSGKNRWNLLLYDTLFRVIPEEGENEPPEDAEVTETRKLWLRIPEAVYTSFNREYEFRHTDIITVVGDLKWYDHYCDYQLTRIKSMALEKRQGDTVILPVEEDEGEGEEGEEGVEGEEGEEVKEA